LCMMWRGRGTHGGAGPGEAKGAAERVNTWILDTCRETDVEIKKGNALLPSKAVFKKRTHARAGRTTEKVGPIERELKGPYQVCNREGPRTARCQLRSNGRKVNKGRGKTTGGGMQYHFENKINQEYS